jgi:hypothetical protein
MTIKLSIMLRKFIEIFVEMVVESIILISAAAANNLGTERGDKSLSDYKGGGFQMVQDRY